MNIKKVSMHNEQLHFTNWLYKYTTLLPYVLQLAANRSITSPPIAQQLRQ